MSMSKTVFLQLTLLCDGQIGSLNDGLGKYSPSLAKTVTKEYQ